MHQPLRRGFTMIEMLLTLAILSILVTTVLWTVRNQTEKARDAERKKDLRTIASLFEDYYNDNDCYPAQTILQNCGGPELSPYTDRVICDPASNQPYLYLPVPGDECSGYRLCANLGNHTDADIEKIGCNPETGCGWGAAYNYCISSGVSVTASGFTP